ncbi:MAG TPA: FAD-binding oxidoreductase [Caulobacteraceae bacterium]|nr:FAD-binding oxidoreductase [Caulobacteraceae bacterium]
MNAIAEDLATALGAAKVATDAEALQARRHDYWALSHIRDLAGAGAPRPACIVRPAGAADVAEVLRIARERGVPVIPFGLGSGVVGGIVASPEAVVLDLGSVAAVRWIDEDNLLACFEAGIRGADAEDAVAARGLTIGHWPQSVALSSVGGWAATRASGQFSTGYGNIEDIVQAIEAVLPSGEVVTLGKGARASAGPDLRALFLGSEGTLGVITAVTLSLRRAPEARSLAAFAAADMDAGFAFQRRLIQAGWRPPVVRQYDARESRRHGGDSGASLLLLVHEGPAALVQAQAPAVAELAADSGLEARDGALVETWLAHRNDVPPWEAILSRHIVADTVEVSAGWTDIGKIYRDAVASLSEAPGCLVASAHSSHAYRSGLNLYFTFAFQTEGPAAMERVYLDAWRRIMEATIAHGGGVSHHHGIGRVRRPWLEAELGAGGLALLRRIKAALDPDGIMNPGVLLP